MSGGRYGKYGEIRRLRRRTRSGSSPSGPPPSHDRPGGSGPGSPASRLRIREARPADRAFVIRLSAHAFRRFGAYAKVIRDWLDSGAALILLALSGDRPAGFAMTARIPPYPDSLPETELLAIAVDPELHRCGIGRRLLREIEAEVRKSGGGLLRLHTATGNLFARALFEDEGFRVAGVERRFYPRGQNALLMIKVL